MSKERRQEPIGTLDELIEKLYADFESASARADTAYREEIEEADRIRQRLGEVNRACGVLVKTIRAAEHAVLASGGVLLNDSTIEEKDIQSWERQYRAEIEAGIRDEDGYRL